MKILVISVTVICQQENSSFPEKKVITLRHTPKGNEMKKTLISVSEQNIDL